jgi:hypothetical protein
VCHDDPMTDKHGIKLFRVMAGAPKMGPQVLELAG